MIVPKIIEFDARYSDQVKRLLTAVLHSLGLTEVHPSGPDVTYPNVTYDDSDLDRIAVIYTDRSRFWLAVMEDEVIGMVAIKEASAAVAVLRRMFVAPNYHGMGVGKRLLVTSLEFAQAQGYRTVNLDTHIGMKRAHAFYEKHGFRKTAEDAQQRHYTLSLEQRSLVPKRP